VVAFFIMKPLFSIIAILMSLTVFGQDSLLVGKKYLEDQIYIGINYNILRKKPDLLQQKGISINYQIGFIKDLPLTKKGDFALGIGLGYAYNKFNQTLKISNTIPAYEIITEDYQKNKFETHALELPIEIRFRNATPTTYKFWRLYIGAKIAYVFASKSIFINSDGEEKIKLTPIPHLNKWQWGPQISFGYGTWNIYAFFNSANLFENAPTIENIDVNQLKTFKIGLQFYIF